MNEAQPILEWLQGQWPWVSNVLTGIGLARVVMKWFSNRLKQFITAAAERASVTLDPEDDTVIEHILRSRTYRVLAYALDLFGSVKLPAAEDLFRARSN